MREVSESPGSRRLCAPTVEADPIAATATNKGARDLITRIRMLYLSSMTTRRLTMPWLTRLA